MIFPTISRRDVVAALPMLPLLATSAAALPVPPVLPVPPGGRIAFRMLRNGEPIGSHVLTFKQSGDALAVSIAIDIQVKLIGMTLYRYSHRATERWQDGQFASIESQTDRDGAPRQMRAVREPDGVVVEGTNAKRYVAPPVALPTTYWNQAMLEPRLINSEDGTLLGVTVTEAGLENVPTAAGPVPARRYRLAGELRLEIWYDDAGQWAHLQFTKDGSTIIYEKL